MAGRCNRDKPPCKYFHPPQHLKDQLLINGRNHLALKNAIMQQMGIAPGQQVIPGQVPTVATNPYLTGIPASTYSPYFGPGHLVPTLLGPDPSVASQLTPVVPQAVPVAQQKIPRSDRLEVCREFMRGACKRAESECRFAHPQESVTTHEDGTVTVCMDAVKGRCTRDPCRYFHPPLHLQAQIKAAQSRASAMDMKTVGSFYYENFAFSGMVPFKRPAAEKSGIPVYQANATTYQQLMQLQQPFVPVSSTNNKIPLNASYVIYTDANGQLLDTLPVCQDFNRSMCSRINCRFVHLMEHDKVEVCDQRVAVCRDHANGLCKRKLCKYYHIPIVLPPANIMATVFRTQNCVLASTSSSTSSTSTLTASSINSALLSKSTIPVSTITSTLLSTKNTITNTNCKINSTISQSNSSNIYINNYNKNNNNSNNYSKNNNINNDDNNNINKNTSILAEVSNNDPSNMNINNSSIITDNNNSNVINNNNINNNYNNNNNNNNNNDNNNNNNNSNNDNNENGTKINININDDDKNNDIIENNSHINKHNDKNISNDSKNDKHNISNDNKNTDNINCISNSSCIENYIKTHNSSNENNNNSSTNNKNLENINSNINHIKNNDNEMKIETSINSSNDNKSIPIKQNIINKDNNFKNNIINYNSNNSNNSSSLYNTNNNDSKNNSNNYKLVSNNKNNYNINNINNYNKILDMNSKVHIVKPAIIRKPITNSVPAISAAIENFVTSPTKSQPRFNNQYFLKSAPTTTITAPTNSTHLLKNSTSSLTTLLNNNIRNSNKNSTNKIANNNDSTNLIPKTSQVNVLNSGAFQQYYWPSFNNNNAVNGILSDYTIAENNTPNFLHKNFQFSNTYNNKIISNSNIHSQALSVTSQKINENSHTLENYCSENLFPQNTSNFPSNIGIYSSHLPIHHNTGLTNVLLTPATAGSTAATITSPNVTILQNCVDNNTISFPNNVANTFGNISKSTISKASNKNFSTS
ncbi:GATA zinc finger domain-containing protein 14-like isoform X2 [Condylostylus longicornis]|uniref:GATA zinc finger domain-containing protein 14-like isoform X2 n=1 Tax=Condylostylus longicornis TaxID=2530218 RepID=UPI00244E1547|nr:GATA zinc finger domain-containing protein 14-like isoform X2 [Condylostylus longicornis]